MRPPHAELRRRGFRGHRTGRSIVLLACIGVALVLGAAGRAASGLGPSFRLATDFDTAGTGCDTFAIGDLNGDRRPDLAVGCDQSPSGITIMFNKGGGRFKYGDEYDEEIVEGLAIADLDGNGKPDLLATTGGTLSVFLNRGDGTFLPSADYPGGFGSVAVADLNGDGSPDLVTGDASTASIWLNRGDGTFGRPVDYGVGRGGDWGPRDFKTGDVNGDGATDLVTPNDRDGTISVLVNRGDGTFGPRQDYPSGREPSSLALVDLNGDGKPDLAATVDGGVSILVNLGDGTFRPRREYRVGDSRKVASGDLNGDRNADLAISSGRGVSVLLGRGDGTFRPKLDYLSGGRRFRYALQVAISDLNGDSRFDLAVTNSSEPSDLAVLLNTPGLCNVQYARQLSGREGPPRLLKEGQARSRDLTGPRVRRDTARGREGQPRRQQGA